MAKTTRTAKTAAGKPEPARGVTTVHTSARPRGHSAKTTSHKVTVQNMMDYVVFEDMDLEARKFVTWEQFERGAEDLARQIDAYRRERGARVTGIHGVPRGGLVLAVKLSYLLDIPLALDPAKVGPETLVVDDCVVSGKTLLPYAKGLTAVLYVKPGSAVAPTFLHERTDQQINFCWESKADRN